MAAQDPVRRSGDEERRPLALLFVYSWDLIRAILAGVAAIAVFGGSRQVGDRIESIPVGVQIVQALAFASLAAALILVGTLLTRRARWVRRAQLVILLMDVVLVAGTLAVALITDQNARNGGVIGFSATFVLIDLLAAVAVTEQRVATYYDEPGPVPVYVGGLIAFWAAASAAFFVLGLVTR